MIMSHLMRSHCISGDGAAAPLGQIPAILRRNPSGLLSPLVFWRPGNRLYSHFEVLLRVANVYLVHPLTGNPVEDDRYSAKTSLLTLAWSLCLLCSYSPSLWSPSIRRLWWVSLRDRLGGASLSCLGRGGTTLKSATILLSRTCSSVSWGCPCCTYYDTLHTFYKMWSDPAVWRLMAGK